MRFWVILSLFGVVASSQTRADNFVFETHYEVKLTDGCERIQSVVERLRWGTGLELSVASCESSRTGTWYNRYYRYDVEITADDFAPCTASTYYLRVLRRSHQTDEPVTIPLLKAMGFRVIAKTSEKGVPMDSLVVAIPACQQLKDR